jgi:DNA-binding NarL/FixJ family response regulator
MKTFAIDHSPRSVTIVIADEHPIFRDGLRRLVETHSTHQIVGDTGDAAVAVKMVHELEPDVLLLSAGNTDAFWQSALQQLAASGAAVSTLLLTGTVDRTRTSSALELGVCGVIPKDSPTTVLFECIDCAAFGSRRIVVERETPMPGRARVFEIAGRRTNSFGLTPREIEIVRGVVEGRTNKAIALRCSISENTVKRHLLHIFDKVGASSRVELALFAEHHQLTRAV